MAVNMNKRDRRQKIFIVLFVFLGIFQYAMGVTTPPGTTDTAATTDAPNVTDTTSTTTPTTTTTVPTTTTTTIAPLKPPTEFDSNSLIGLCPCDLTGNACDVNCDCDEDCTAEDKAAFTHSLPFSTNVDDRLCFRKEIVLFENSPVISDFTDDDLFCIYYDNKAERNFYTNPDLVQTQTTFAEYLEEFPTFTFQSDQVTTIDSTASFYKAGDPIYTVFESEAVGMLGLPNALTTMECIDGNPAGYWTDQSHICSRSIENLNLNCDGPTSAAGLDANSFTSGFRVVSSPQMFQKFNTTPTGIDGFYSLYNNSYTLDVELDRTGTEDPIQCISPTTNEIGPCGYNTLPYPSVATADTCKDVVRQVHYRMITSSTTGIVKVLARFVLSSVSVSSAGATFTQTFSTTFEAERSDTSEPFQRSGNPGYVVGEPVLAGTLNQTTQGDSVVDQILLSSNRDRYMTMVKASATGDCLTDSDSRISVVFGENQRTGCFLRESASNLTAYCALMQQKIIETMEFDSIPIITAGGFRDNNRYVGLYGNSDVSKTGDWVKILYPNRPPPIPPSGSACKLTLGMHIQILYANIGALINPQPKIIGVSFIYDSTTTVQIRPTLNGLFDQAVEVTASVAFIDVSKPAVGYQGEPPIFLAKLPYDFFYPFTSGGANTPKHTATGELHVPLEVCGAVVKRELDFWQIDEMEIKACCWRHYRSYIENQAILDSFNNSLLKENVHVDLDNLKGWERFQWQVWLILEYPRTSRMAVGIKGGSI